MMRCTDCLADPYIHVFHAQMAQTENLRLSFVPNMARIRRVADGVFVVSNLKLHLVKL